MVVLMAMGIVVAMIKITRLVLLVLYLCCGSASRIPVRWIHTRETILTDPSPTNHDHTPDLKTLQAKCLHYFREL